LNGAGVLWDILDAVKKKPSTRVTESEFTKLFEIQENLREFIYVIKEKKNHKVSCK